MRRPHVYQRSAPRRAWRQTPPEPTSLAEVVEVRIGGAVGYVAVEKQEQALSEAEGIVRRGG